MTKRDTINGTSWKCEKHGGRLDYCQECLKEKINLAEKRLSTKGSRGLLLTRKISYLEGEISRLKEELKVKVGEAVCPECKSLIRFRKKRERDQDGK